MVPCTACGSPQTANDPFYYDWQGQRYWIRRCRSCTHQFVFPSIGPAQQVAMYGDQYFAPGGDWVCGLMERKGYEEAYDNLVREAGKILALLPIQHGRLLDIGCAGGVFLSEARAAGFTVTGIELNTWQAETARTRFGLDVLNTRIEDAPRDLGPFDVVTLLDVLEHLPRPLETMQKVCGWMRAGGYVLVRGPLTNDRVAQAKEAIRRVLGFPKRLPGYPLDANRFNLRSLTLLLQRTGFGVSRIHATHDFANVLAQKNG